MHLKLMGIFSFENPINVPENVILTHISVVQIKLKIYRKMRLIYE